MNKEGIKNLREALWWQKGEGATVFCELCPHRCRIKDGQIGLCGVRKNKGGRLVCLTDGFYVTGHLDPIEKKPLAGFHPGSWIYSLGTAGCNLRCDFCQNWELVHAPIDKQGVMSISDESIIELASEEPSIGIAFTYNEPLMNYEQVLRLAKLAKNKGLVTVVISNGYINREPMLELRSWIDAWNIDLKSIRDPFYRQLCGGHVTPVLASIRLAAETSHLEISTLLIEGENTSDEELDELAATIGDIDPSIPLHLSRYFPAYKRHDPPTPLTTMYRARDICQKQLEFVYLGNCR